MTRAAAAVAAVLTLLIVVGAASAQTVDKSVVADSLRVEWDRVTDRPGIEGYVYNESLYRIGLVRLAILYRDDPSQAPATDLAWVYGNVPARGRWYFRVRTPASREVLKVTIESFQLIARDPVPQSP